MLRSIISHRYAAFIRGNVDLQSLHINVSTLKCVRQSVRTSSRFYTQPSHQWMQQQNKQTYTLSQDQIELLQNQQFLTTEEETVFKKLLKEFNPVSLSVKDVSGGCGSMYSIHITSERFNNLPIVRQHQMVNEFLKEDIAKWHGIQLTTKKVRKPKD